MRFKFCIEIDDFLVIMVCCGEELALFRNLRFSISFAKKFVLLEDFIWNILEAEEDAMPAIGVVGLVFPFRFELVLGFLCKWLDHELILFKVPLPLILMFSKSKKSSTELE